MGGGILGTMTALLLADGRCSVTLFERNRELLTETSAVGEGKVHLGLVYAQGDRATRRHMLEGALSFQPLVERAVGRSLEWDLITSPPFINIVMPDSLLSVAELREIYKAHNEDFASMAQMHGRSYLGRKLDRLVEPDAIGHEKSGLPGFSTHERAVSTSDFSRILVTALDSRDEVTVVPDAVVTEISHRAEGACVRWHPNQIDAPEGDMRVDDFDAVVNCTWDQQLRFVSPPNRDLRNIRFKTSLRIPLDAMPRAHRDTVTLVTGPYGDVVAFDDYTYVSWYPTGRLAFEEDWFPSDSTEQRVRSLLERRESVDEQIRAISDLGFLPSIREIDVERVVVSGGYIIGNGRHDIDRRDSGLHSRRRVDTLREGRIFTPCNYKSTTAPLEADRVVQMVRSELALGVGA